MTGVLPVVDGLLSYRGASQLSAPNSATLLSSSQSRPDSLSLLEKPFTVLPSRDGAISSPIANMEEERTVSSAPICVRRLRGPGRVRRTPPGTAYLSAGALLRRLLRYSEDGEVLVEVVREVAGGVILTVGHPKEGPVGAITPENVLSEELPPRAQTSRAQTQSKNAKRVRTMSETHRESVSLLARETERQHAAEQESKVSSLLQALPLLRVLPPQSLLQQSYTEDLSAEPTSSSFTTLRHSQGLSASTPIFSTTGLSHGGLPETGIVSSSGCGAGVKGRLPVAHAHLRGAVMSVNAERHNIDQLCLRSEVLFTPEETALSHGAEPLPTSTQSICAASSSAHCVDHHDDLYFHLLSSLSMVSSRISPSRAAAQIPVPQEAVRSRGATAAIHGADCPAEEELLIDLDVSRTCVPQPAPAAAGTLSGIFVDGGFGVTIKLGASCDEPNSLRSVAWGGCRPALLRAVVWRLLSEYAPAAVARQKPELQRKRRQYEGYTRQYCNALTMLSLRKSPLTLPSLASSTRLLDSGGAAGGADFRDTLSLSRLTSTRPSPTRSLGIMLNSGGSTTPALESLSSHEQSILHQMLLDLPRHQSPIFHAERSLAGMARCLFLWSQRHPAVGYVQGMDDVVAVFYQVFLTDALRQFVRDSESAVACRCTSHCSSAAPAVQLQKRSAAAVRYDPENSRAWGDSGDTALSTNTKGQDSMIGEEDTHAVMRLLLLSLTASEQRISGFSAPPSAPSGISTLSEAAAGAAGAASAATLSPYLSEADVGVLFDNPATLDAVLAELPESYLMQVEGDTYWCAGRVLSVLQDNFMPGQPGILRNVRRLESLVREVDAPLMALLDGHGLTVMDGCFQWIHCLLARELPLTLLLRLWDCYLSIGIGGDRAPTTTPATNGARPLAVSLTSTMGVRGTSASDEAIMYFHVCVCCALLRDLRVHLTGSSSDTVTSAAPLASSGRWAAAAIATVLPVFGPRSSSHEGDGTSATCGVSSGTALASAPGIDVIMNVMKHPFEALFPHYVPARRQQPLSSREDDPDPMSKCAGPTASEDDSLAAAMRWLDVLIADAYCIWRQHPMPD